MKARGTTGIVSMSPSAVAQRRYREKQRAASGYEEPPDIDYSWQEQGACIEVPDPSIFFPARGEYEGVLAAKRICSGCPVREACARHGIAHEKYGIWGGLSERQRKITRRETGIVFRAPAAHNSTHGDLTGATQRGVAKPRRASA